MSFRCFPRWFLPLLLLCVCLSIVACGDDDDDDNDDAAGDDDSGDDDDNDTAGDDDNDTAGDDDDDTGGDDDDDTPSPEDLIAEGRYWLQAGEPERARVSFLAALEFDPENAEAHYGVTLSGGLRYWELISLISGFLVDPENGHTNPEGLAAKDIDINRELIRQIIAFLQDGVFGPVAETTRASSDWLAEHGDPPFYIEDVPVTWVVETVAWLGEEFDGAERLGCTAIANIFDGFGGSLLALEFDYNISYIMEVDFNGDVIEIIAAVVDFLDEMLTAPGYPNNFMIDEDMIDLVHESRLYLGSGMVGLKATLRSLRSETDDQADDVIAYDDANENGVFDDGEAYMLPGYGTLNAEDMALVAALEDALFDLGRAFLDRTDLDLEPGVDNPFHASSLNGLLSVLGVPPLIPDFLTVNVADFYENLEPDSIRNFLETLVGLLQMILPDAG
ncbi:MAG: hypothetical protein P9L99_11885 [Candidatus Lernaella stagnicola]|nr:hypothetical protein [Candidatus Lernaella stagnicola]